jgi:glucoamylase
MGAADRDFERWLGQQYRGATANMLVSLSPVDIVKTRPGFGQTIQPVKGSIVASPVLADWDPEPDYFFHWFRDSAVVVDAVRLLFEAGDLGPEAVQHFNDFVRFSLGLQDLDGRKVIANTAWRENAAADFIRFLRSDEELESVYGAAIVAETRVNPDGTLDLTSWTRPQYDGAPLRALAVLRWVSSQAFAGKLRGLAGPRQLDAKLPPSVSSQAFDAELREMAAALIRSDLEFTFSHWREPSYDIWEEENGRHYYTLCVSAAALQEGAEWLEAAGEAGLASAYRAETRNIHRTLDGYWLPDAGHYRSRVLTSGERSAKELDISVILAAIHTAGATHSAGPTHPEALAHSPRDPRMHATLERLEALFDTAYPINRNRAPQTAPAMGRYAGDRYFSGGAYYFSTLGAAEFCFRAAAHGNHATWVAKGDAFLRTVRNYTPENGELSEQFDQRTGVQTSARHLAWSYAAFISCMAARSSVVPQPQSEREE